MSNNGQPPFPFRPMGPPPRHRPAPIVPRFSPAMAPMPAGSFPPGPGLPPRAIPLDPTQPGQPLDDARDVVEVERPLARMPENNRGMLMVLPPPRGDIQEAPGAPSAYVESQPQSLVRSQVHCRVGESLIVTLGIYLDNPTDATVTNNGFTLPFVRALLKWGVGGVSFSALCDWMVGTQLSIAAETIEVSAIYRKSSLPWEPLSINTLPTFKVSAGLSYGSIAKNSSPARLTELVQMENQNDTATIAIPAFATSFTVVPISSSQWSARVLSYSSLYEANYAGGGAATDATTYQVENAFPLFNGARAIEFKSQEAEDYCLLLVIFDLAL